MSNISKNLQVLPTDLWYIYQYYVSLYWKIHTPSEIHLFTSIVYSYKYYSYQ